jgi:hypothetical protein
MRFQLKVLQLKLDFYSTFLNKVLERLDRCIAINIRFLLTVFKE